MLLIQLHISLLQTGVLEFLIAFPSQQLGHFHTQCGHVGLQTVVVRISHIQFTGIGGQFGQTGQRLHRPPVGGPGRTTKE